MRMSKMLMPTLKEIPSDYIRITEEIPFDTMITPIS